MNLYLIWELDWTSLTRSLPTTASSTEQQVSLTPAPSTPAHCSRGGDYAFAPFEMSRTVATDNNLVCEDYFWTIIGREEGLGGLSSHDD